MSNPTVPAITPVPRTPLAMRIAGWVLTLLVSAAMTMSAVFKLLMSPEVVEGFGKMNIGHLALHIGITELVCTILYLIPQTAVLGAILLTGYLGGAVLADLQMGGLPIAPVVIGVLAWLGLYLRDARVRGLAPIRKL